MIVVPVNPLATAPEITHQLKDSDAETMVVMASSPEGPSAFSRPKPRSQAPDHLPGKEHAGRGREGRRRA